MFNCSEEALECHDVISVACAAVELARHGCRVLSEAVDVKTGPRILVTNGFDKAEWVDCTPSAILIWLGY